MGITLGKKQLNKGRVSLYLNYSYNGKRRKEYLGIILDAPTSAERWAENRNKVLIARQIRAKKELEFLSVEYHLNDIENTFDDILPTDKSNVPDFYILIGQYLDTYHKKDKKMVRACITHLRLFTRKKSLPVTLLTKDFCINSSKSASAACIMEGLTAGFSLPERSSALVPPAPSITSGPKALS